MTETPPPPTPAKGGADSGDLARQVSVSMLWVALGTIFSKLIRVAALFVVLGLITKAELGVAQIALTVFVILQSVTEMGLGAALVRAKNVDDDDLAALFWVSMAASVGLYVVVFGLSFALAYWYAQPILAPLIQVQALGVLCFSLFVVPKSLLVRDLRMGRVTLAENLAGGLSAVVMMVLAATGLGIWSIIVGEVSARFFEMVIYQASRPYFPRFVWAPRRIRTLISFGLYNTGSRFLGRFYTEVDYLVIGKMFSDAMTGLYAFAFRTVDDIVKALVYMVNQVAYPTFARLQDRPDELRVFLFGIARGTGLLIGIVLAFLFAFMEPVLEALGYDQWLPAVPLVRIFAIIGLLRSVLPLLSSVINAYGEARYMLMYALVLSLTLPVAFVIGGLIAFEGVALAWIVVFPPVSLLLFRRVAKLTGTPVLALMRGVGAGLVFPVVLTSMLVAVRAGLESVELAPGLIAVVGLLLALGAGGGFAWRYERAFIDRVFRKKKKAAAT
jgi:O-antigen/teichoic acid export membrane protein